MLRHRRALPQRKLRVGVPLGGRRRPADQTPRRIGLAWRSIESNEFGLNSFLKWARQAGVEPMLAVNLGTRGVLEASYLVKYANVAGDTPT